jgi:hypothetical protein
MTDTIDWPEIAAYYAASGTGRLTVTEDSAGAGYTFRITGRTNSLTISDDEAVALAETILQCASRQRD